MAARPYQKRQEVKLDYEVDLRGETCTSVFVVDALTRENRDWLAADPTNPDTPSPYIRTPGGQFLSENDLGELLAEDGDRIAEVVVGFLPGRRRQAAATPDQTTISQS